VVGDVSVGEITLVRRIYRIGERVRDYSVVVCVAGALSRLLVQVTQTTLAGGRVMRTVCGDAEFCAALRDAQDRIHIYALVQGVDVEET